MAKNIDDEKTQREREEDLLEFIYSLWRQEKEISVTEYAMEKGMYERKAAAMVNSLVKQGYLDPSSKKGMLKLTEKGQVKGLDILARHEQWNGPGGGAGGRMPAGTLHQPESLEGN